MPNFKIAHIKERNDQGQDVHLIIIPLEPAFGHKSSDDQKRDIAELQARAEAAGLIGIVVPVWDAGAGRMGFVALPQWHPYFSKLTLSAVAASINRELSW